MVSCHGPYSKVRIDVPLSSKSILTAFLALIYMTLPVPSAWGVEVVVNFQVKSRPVSQNSLRAIFGMRMHRWSDGTPIRVFVLQDDSLSHKAFCKEILHVFPHQLRRTWDRLVFSGIGQAPSVVFSEGEMFTKVATTPGAIGYMETDKTDNRVRILSVQ